MHLKPAAAIRLACLLAATLLAREAGADPKNLKNCKTLSAPGSYVLADNLNAAGDCLVLAADFVTIDLNGFSIAGNGTGSAVKSENDDLRKGIRIFNGTIRSFETGVNFGFTGTQISVERVHVIDNSNVGIGVNQQAIVKDCVLSGNGDGINVGSRSLVVGNNSSFNTASGIVVGVGSTIIGNTVGVNGNNGLVASNSSTVLNNTAQVNGNFGLFVTCASNVIGNTATNNGTNMQLSGAGCNNNNNVAP
jgi:hypothetical protein